MYWMSLLGDSLYFVGFVVMSVNLWKTASAGRATDESVEITVTCEAQPSPCSHQFLLARPVWMFATLATLIAASTIANSVASVTFVFLAVLFATFCGLISIMSTNGAGFQRALEASPPWLTLFILVPVLLGSLVELVPILTRDDPANAESYSALELAGRDVYIAEGCCNCHSQMIRPFLWEAARYGGEVSRPEDSALDHPFQWGSRRIGPDLARVGGKYPHSWHYDHLLDPRSLSAASNMPSYRHLTTSFIHFAGAAEEQAQAIVSQMRSELGAEAPKNLAANSKMVALIAYLQRLGRDSKETK
jgi:cytochrome c oxidase cbb3-type subunit I/II